MPVALTRMTGLSAAPRSAQALGEEAAAEIAALDTPFPALIELVLLVVCAMTGEAPEDVRARFRSATA